MKGNGENEFYILVKSPFAVYREEWLELLCIINNLLMTYKDGRYCNVTANLEDSAPT
jgi:hypothetical protein